MVILKNKKSWLFLFLFLSLVSFVSATPVCGDGVCEFVEPGESETIFNCAQDCMIKPKSEILKTETIVISKNAKLVIPSEFENNYNASIDSFKQTISNFNEVSNPMTIDLKLISKGFIAQDKENIQNILETKEDSYFIAIYQNKIDIYSNSLQGLLNGFTTLELKLMVSENGEIQQGRILDWPDLRERVVHRYFYTKFNIPELKEHIKQARLMHYNGFVLQLRGFGIMFESDISCARNNERWDESWSTSKQEFLELIEFTEENGLEFIPELKLLSHQGAFIGLGCEPEKYYYLGRYSDTSLLDQLYDPRNEEVYTKFVFPTIDELLELKKFKKFHIGHDEVNQYVLSPELFEYDIVKIHDYLKEKGVQTIMWGDRLLNKSEFKDVCSRVNTNNYTKLRETLPKDIIIYDWHYGYYDGCIPNKDNFSTSEKFADAGFEVLGASWDIEQGIIGFSEYIKLSNYAGMVATTWLDGINPDIPWIITKSGQIFWEADGIGCKEEGGYCLQEINWRCTDSDGIDEFTKGTIVDIRGETKTDWCYTATKVREFYCGDDGILMEQDINCNYGCNQGACNNETVEIILKCRYNNVWEFLRTIPLKEVESCDYGCLNGVCLEKPVDSGGGGGGGGGGSSGGTIITQEDNQTFGTYSEDLNETVNSFNNSLSKTPTGIRKKSFVTIVIIISSLLLVGIITTLILVKKNKKVRLYKKFQCNKLL